jgi:2-polyprenyl-3-methyl-5-hydroxy-6-metoxy-1,4-benzoquinol methylase
MSWYDRAEIYDIAFSWEIEPELDFLHEVWNQYGQGKLHRIYEPFCGSGRLLVPLAEQGHECVGTDLSAAMLDCLRAKIGKRGLPIEVHQADVCTYQCAPPADMGVTLIDSFRHLTTAESASAAIHTLGQLEVVS